MGTEPETLGDGRYVVVRVLGEGAQATTFEAVDKRVGRLVAVKRFRVRGAKSWKEVELAEREARVLAALDHPSLPRYVDHFEEGGELFLVTEKIEGQSLADHRRSGARFAEADVLRLLRDASVTLDYLHGRAPPIIHRDIKPSNVLLRPDGSFALIDFGAVRDKLRPEGGSTVVGTFGYMAPEQFQGRAMPTSDVYAVAATALSMLTGREPEELPHRGLSIDVAAALAGTRASPALVRLLTAMLEPDPDKRPASIAPLLSTLGAEVPPPRDEQRAAGVPGRRSERVTPPSGLASGVVLVAVLLALTAAELAVTVVLRALLPLALTALSIVFGKGMRRAAGSSGEAGKAAAAWLQRSRDRVRFREPPRRVRVAAPPGVRVEVGDDDEAAEEEARVSAEQTRRRGAPRP